MIELISPLNNSTKASRQKQATKIWSRFLNEMANAEKNKCKQAIGNLKKAWRILSAFLRIQNIPQDSPMNGVSY